MMRGQGLFKERSEHPFHAPRSEGWHILEPTELNAAQVLLGREAADRMFPALLSVALKWTNLQPLIWLTSSQKLLEIVLEAVKWLCYIVNVFMNFKTHLPEKEHKWAQEAAEVIVAINVAFFI